MSAYDSVDRVIKKWVNTLGTTLCTEVAGEPARFFYMSGDPPFECFQINIPPPVGDRLQVFAYAIDTNDDTDDEMEAEWSGSTDELDGMIQSAVTTIQGWKSRIRKKPDPPSPW